MWHVKLCEPLLTRAITERLRDEQLIIKRCTNKDSFFPSFMLRVVSASVCLSGTLLYCGYIPKRIELFLVEGY